VGAWPKQNRAGC